MELLIWSGAAISVAGLAAIIWCIFRIRALRAQDLDDDALRTALMRLVPVNMGALLGSVLGLMMIVFGIVLG